MLNDYALPNESTEMKPDLQERLSKLPKVDALLATSSAEELLKVFSRARVVESAPNVRGKQGDGGRNSVFFVRTQEKSCPFKMLGKGPIRDF